MLSSKKHRFQQQKKQLPEKADTQMPELDVQDEDPPRRKREWAAPLAFLLVLALAIAALPTPSQEDASGREVAQAVLSGSPERETVTRMLYTAGTLSDEDSISVKIPCDVEVKAFLVSNGQRVQQGDVLLTVEKSSVMDCIRQLQERLDALDDEIEDEKDAAVSSVISAPADARVKEIYAVKEKAVAGTMYRHGMLLRLSLDGLMAVDLETDGLEAGQSVTVTLPDGTEEAGRVTRVQEGIAHITLSDETAQYDDPVTVTDERGKTIGTGNLIINSELRITGYAGTVSQVCAEEGKKVSRGATLLTLTDTALPARQESLLRQREEMEAQLTSLIQMYQDGCIYSEFEGIVSGVDETLVKELAFEEAGYQVVLLSNVTDGGTEPEGTDSGPLEGDPSEPSDPFKGAGVPQSRQNPRNRQNPPSPPSQQNPRNRGIPPITPTTVQWSQRYPMGLFPFRQRLRRCLYPAIGICPAWTSPR
ncbi:MAG: biotin/lipoyl-binding protein [Eubacteriales bacterium]|nr:biotin/lipoyl-binding protein [Eubacteriales bacterium]